MTGIQVQGNANTVATDGGVTVRDNLGNIVTGGGSIIETLEVQYSAMREVAPLVDESLQDVASASFVAPSEATPLSQKLSQEHILILQGMARWGKASLAHYLALLLTEQDSKLQAKTMVDHSLLTDVLLNLKREKNIILILYNAKAVVFGREIDELRKLAQSQNNFLILTTTNSPQVWKLTETQQSAFWWNVEAQSPYTSANLTEILQKQAQSVHNFDQILGGQSAQDIASSLASPASIVRFVELLNRAEAGTDIDQLIRSARNVEDEIIKWYDELDRSSQYFILALTLFNGLNREQFWAAYESLMREVWQKRDRNLALVEDYSLQKMYDFVEETETHLRFKNSEYREIVLRYAIRGYRRALVQALPFLSDMILKSVGGLSTTDDSFASFELYGSSAEPLYQVIQKRRAIRNTIAEAVSWVAKEEPKAVDVLLLKWAQNPSPEVRETACLTLLQSLRRGDGYTPQDMLNQLLIWYKGYKAERVEDLPASAYIRSTAGIGAGYLARLLNDNKRTMFSLDKYLENVHSREISIPSDVSPLELLAIVSSDANYRTRQGAAIGAGVLGVTDFDSAEPILRILANDWTENARLQVIQVLMLLSLVHYEGVTQNLSKWLASSQPVWKQEWNKRNSQRWSSDEQVEAAQMTSDNARSILEIDQGQLRGDYDWYINLKGEGGPCYWTSTLALFLISSLHQNNEVLKSYHKAFGLERNLDSRKQALSSVISYLISRGRESGIYTFARLCKTDSTGIACSTLEKTLKDYGKENTETAERLVQLWESHATLDFEKPTSYLKRGIQAKKTQEDLKKAGEVAGVGALGCIGVIFWIVGAIIDALAGE